MTPYEREQLLALAQKWREESALYPQDDLRGVGAAVAVRLCAVELTALADQLGPEQAQDEVARLRQHGTEYREKIAEMYREQYRLGEVIDGLNAELSRLRGELSKAEAKYSGLMDSLLTLINTLAPMYTIDRDPQTGKSMQLWTMMPSEKEIHAVISAVSAAALYIDRNPRAALKNQQP